MAEAVNPQAATTTENVTKETTPASTSGAAMGAVNIPASLGYGQPKGTEGILPGQQPSEALGYGEAAAKMGPESYASRKDQEAQYLAQSGDIQGAMDASQARNQYMTDNGLGYNPKATPLAPGQTNVPGNLGYNAPTYAVPATPPKTDSATPTATGTTGAQAATSDAKVEGTEPTPPAPATTPTGDAVTTYANNITNSLDEFMNKTVSTYQSIIDDMTKNYASYDETVRAGMDNIIKNLEKKEALYQKEKEDTIKREEARRDHLLTVIEQKQDNELKQNELAAKETDAMWAQREDLASDNLTRLQGFLEAKMVASGFPMGSAAMQAIGKYMAAAEMSFTDITRSRASAKATYAAKAKQIMDESFEQIYQVEYDASTKISEVTFKMNDALLAIDEQKVTTEMSKNQQIFESMKELNNQKLAIESEKNNKILQITQEKRAEAQFAHQVTMDYAQKKFQEDQFAFQKEVDARNYARSIIESDRNYNLTADEQDFSQKYRMKTFDENVRQFGLEYALDKLRLDEQKRQFDETMTYNKDQAALQADLDNRDFRASMVEKGLMSPATLDQYLTAEDVIASRDYVGQDGSVENLGDKVASVFEAAGTGIKNLANGYQCVQFVRDIVPDLPTGLFTLADKIRVLTKGKGSIQAPEPGATVVLNWGKGTDPNTKPGHVAFVTNVAPDGRSFDIVQFNAPKPGQKSTQTIRTDDGSIVGYWKSPRIQPASQGKNSTVIQNAPTDIQSMADTLTSLLPKDKRDSVLGLLGRQVNSGNIEQAKNFLMNNVAREAMEANNRKDYDSARDLASELDRNLKNMESLTSASGPYKWLLESTKPWATLEKDPEFMSAIGNAMLSMQKYKTENFGTSTTGNEAKSQLSFLVQPDDTFNEVVRKMNDMRTWSDRAANREVDRVLGKDVMRTTSQYDQVRVRDEDGKEGYIERRVYDADPTGLILLD